MRILHINKFFDLNGGAEGYMHRLMEAQQKAGDEVHALSTSDPSNLPSKDRSRFVTRSDLARREGMVIDAQKAARFVWNREARKAVTEALRELRPNVVHLHNIYHHLSSSILAPIRAGHISCVQTLHDYKLICPNYRLFTEGAPCERCKGGKYFEAVKHRCLAAGLIPNLLAAFEMGMTKARQSYERTVGTFICPSQFMKEKMEDWGEPSSKLCYLPNPVELPNDPAPRGGGYLLYVGRVVEEKGLRSFLEAAIQIPELPVKIVGRGGEEERLKSLVRASHATHIEFLGFQPPAFVAKARARAEALVSPSLWYENASLSILEALADGLPCLVSRIGGNPELIEDGVNGFLAKPGNVEDWIRVLRRFQAVSTTARETMSVVNRKKIEEKFLWGTHLERLKDIYKINMASPNE